MRNELFDLHKNEDSTSIHAFTPTSQNVTPYTTKTEE